MSPRVFIITDQVQIGRALEHRLNTIWADVSSRIYSPRHSGRLHSAFTAAGYDLVILDERADRGRGAQWLSNLLHRPEFAPIIYLLPRGASGPAEFDRSHGAVACFVRDRIDHAQFAQAAKLAVKQRERQLEELQSGPGYVAACRFGDSIVPAHRFVRELATGGNARLYLAESEEAGEMVVLKMLSHTGDGQTTRLAYARFLQEYALISRIRHPNIVRIMDLGSAGGCAYIAMEYFPAGDLRTRMNKPINVVLALKWLAQMASALEAVHALNILHRDLKPGNVMLRADGSIALIDFGIAKSAETDISLTAAGAIFGTPYYMSPEQGHGEAVDQRSDLYSLGVMFYEMLMRRKPYTAPTPMGVIYLHRNAPLPEFSREFAALQPLLDRLLAKQPADRFPSATALLQQLDRMSAKQVTA